MSAGAVVAAVDQLDLEGGEERLGDRVVQADPVWPIDWRSPSRAQASMQAVEVYSLPRMLPYESRGLGRVVGWRRR